MAQAKHEETYEVDAAKLFDAIASYADYPDFVDGCKEAKVLSSTGGKTKVFYRVSKIKDVEYTLEHVQDKANLTLSWTLVESPFFKKNSGKWTLKPLGEGETLVQYEVDVEFSISVPGFLLKGLISGSLPSMVESFVDRAND